MNERWIRFVRRVAVGAAVVGSGWIFSDRLAAQNSGRGSPSGDVVNGHETASNEVLVKFRRALTADERAQIDAIIDADQDNDLDGAVVRRFHSRRFDTASLVNYFLGAPNVEYAEPNYIVYAIATPNDPSFGQLWGLFNSGQTINGQAGIAGADIRAKAAWDVTIGSRDNVIGVVDTGIDYTHQDLAANIWAAPAAFTVNIANQNVTCLAGSHGFRSMGGVMSCDPLDDNNHGSHVSGTIGAAGNNATGVVGVNWTASIMGLKFLDSSGSGSTADAINVMEFAIQAKNRFGAAANLRVLSNSWGGGGFSQTLLNEINKANSNNMLFVAAAGNNSANNDSTSVYPANYNAANVIAVAATDNRDAKASFSNYGATMVDLGAPGVSVLSTIRNNAYAYFSGTSMATPHVSGAAALVLAACPALSTASLRSAILGTVDPIASMAGITVTGGRLNVNNAVRSCSGSPQPPPAPTGLTATAGNAQVTLNWNASSGATGYNVYRGTAPGQEGAVPLNASPVAALSYTDTTAQNGTTYYYKVTAVNANGQSAPSNEAVATPTAPPAVPPPPTITRTFPSTNSIAVVWTSSSGATSYRLKRLINGQFQVVQTTTATYVIDSGLASHTTYTYVVTAVNAAGESAPSNQVSATTQ